MLIITIIIIIIINNIIIVVIVLSNECSTFLEMMNDIGIDKMQQHYIIKKMISLAIRATYFILCHRNKTWDSLDLIKL